MWPLCRRSYRTLRTAWSRVPSTREEAARSAWSPESATATASFAGTRKDLRWHWINDQDGLCSRIHWGHVWSTGGLTVPFTFRHFSSRFLLKDTTAGDTAADGHYDGGSSSTGTPRLLHDASGLAGHNVGNMLWDSNTCTGRLNADAHNCVHVHDF